MLDEPIIHDKIDKLLVRSECPLSESIARILIRDDLIRVYYPENRDEFKAVVKRLNYIWKRPYWVREVVATAVQPHRAAELAHDLLAARFCVKADETIIRMALNASYEPEPRRIILRMNDDPYKGWFRLWWARDEDCYHLAKKLPGAKYARPYVVVPPENFEDVLDFAEIHAFTISDEAMAVVGVAQAEREAAIVVNMPKKESNTVPMQIGIPKLIVPHVVEIDAELRDEDGESTN